MYSLSRLPSIIMIDSNSALRVATRSSLVAATPLQVVGQLHEALGDPEPNPPENV